MTSEPNTKVTDDLFGQIGSLAESFRANEAALRTMVKNLSERLTAMCTGIPVFYQGKAVTLRVDSPDSFTYGQLGFRDDDGLGVWSRSSEDDVDRDPYPSYKWTPIEECPLGWIETLFEKKQFEALLPGILNRVGAKVATVTSRVTDLQKLLLSPTAAVASSFEAAAQQLGYERALADWADAQSALNLDPEEAIGKACVLLETVCKHILGNLNEDLPADKTVQGLWKGISKALHLDPAGEANPPLKGLCGGLFTVAQQIGALRTSHGDAHGKGPEYQPLDHSHARLAVNAAGCAATFLMERWQAGKASNS